MILLKDIVIRKNIAIDKNVLLETAINKMYQNSNGVVVIVSNDIAIGIITQKDILNIVTKSTDLKVYIKNIFIKDNITASFGVTQFNEFDNESTIIKRADEAIYKAKCNGKNQVVLV